MSVANLLVVAGTFWLEHELRHLNGANTTDIAGLLVTAVAVLVMTLIAVVLSLWSLSAWAVRLAAFARAITLHGARPTSTHFDDALQSIRSRKKFLAKVWLLASLYLAVPVLPLCVLIALKVLTGPEYSVNGEQLVPLPPQIPAALLHNLSVGLGSVLSIVSLAYSFIVIVFSAVSDEPPLAIVTESLKQLLRSGGLLLLLTTIIFLLNVLITAPYMLFIFTSLPVIMKQSLPLSIAAQVWLGMSSAVMWPLSLVPFAQMLKCSGPSAALECK